jgi:hypothetical protein
MEIAAEAKLHTDNARRDLKMIWRRVVRARPPKWAVAFLCVAMLVMGWLGGWNRGYVDGHATSHDFNTIIQMRNLDQLQAGNNIAAITFAAQQVDRLVMDAAERSRPQTLRASVWERLSPLWWMDRNYVDQERKRVRDTAELRLRLPGPSGDTLSAMKAANREWLIEQETRELSVKAAWYSTVLGREVPAAALLTDAALRRALNASVAWAK